MTKNSRNHFIVKLDDVLTLNLVITSLTVYYTLIAAIVVMFRAFIITSFYLYRT